MALAYPEGECFFKRSALNSSSYNPDKPEHFYAHLLVEYIWNRPAFSGDSSAYNQAAHYHPRSPYRVVKGDYWSTRYGNWDRIHFLYGKQPHSDRESYRHVQHNLCVNGNRFRDQEKGGSLESWFMIIPMPMLARGEEWFLIDRTACIRGIYIPVAQQSSEDYPEICTFLHVNFALTREVSILTYPEVYDPDNREYVVREWVEPYHLDATLGFAVDAKWTLAINIRGLVSLLSLPRQLRGHNCFSAHIIRMVDRKVTPTRGEPQKFSDASDISWKVIASANYGLAIQWRLPEPSTWLIDFIRNTLTAAVGFIPVVGPIAAVCFPLAWSAIADPDAFEETLHGVIPVAGLVTQVASEIERDTRQQVAFLPKGWSTSAGLLRLTDLHPEGGGTGETGATPRAGAAQAEARAETRPQTMQDPKVSPNTLKKLESVRNFKYWNLMKVSATVTEVSEARGDDEPPPPPVPIVISHSEPEKIPLEELAASSSFQLAKQVLAHSSNATDTIGTTDKAPAVTLEEILPETPEFATEDSKDGGPATVNDFDWMDAYLTEELM